MSIKDDVIRSFKEGSFLTRLIYVNLGAFVLVNLAVVFCLLFGVSSDWTHYLMLPASVKTMMVHPWTLLTYMFLHMGFVHLICNILMLYWFGQLFLLFFNQKDLVGLYLFGGLVGGLFYFSVFNLVPFYANQVDGGFLLGASASVTAIVVATAVASPEYQVRVPLIGNVKIEWIALTTVVISLLGITSFNAGGELAHLGGALAGYLFASQYKKGNNIVAWINGLIDRVCDWTRGRKKMRVSYENHDNPKNADMDYNAKKKQKENDIDLILEKIKRSGYDSLSSEERKKLFGK